MTNDQQHQAIPAPDRASPDRSPTASVQDQRPTLAGLLQASGWLSVWGGVLLGVDVVAHLFVDDTFVPTELLGLPHELWHVPGVFGIVAVLLGLIGIHLRQVSNMDKLGLVGFVLLFIGVTLGAAYSTVFHAVLLPALEGVREGLFEELTDNTTTGQTVRGIAVQAIGLGLGAILFGSAIIRARVLPALGGWLIIAAALFAAANEAFDGAQLISRTLFALVFVVLGSALLREPDPAIDQLPGMRRT